MLVFLNIIFYSVRESFCPSHNTFSQFILLDFLFSDYNFLMFRAIGVTSTGERLKYLYYVKIILKCSILSENGRWNKNYFKIVREICFCNNRSFVFFSFASTVKHNFTNMYTQKWCNTFLRVFSQTTRNYSIPIIIWTFH